MKHTTISPSLGGYAKHIGWAIASSATVALFAIGAMYTGDLAGKTTVEVVAEPMTATQLRDESHESNALSGKDGVLQDSMGSSSTARDAESVRHEEEKTKQAEPVKTSRARVNPIKRTKRIPMPPPPRPVDLNAPASMFLSQDGTSQAGAPGALLSATVDPTTGLGSRSAREYAEEAKKGSLIDPSKMPSGVAEMVDLGGVPVYQPEKKVGVAVRPMFPAGVSVAGKFH